MCEYLFINKLKEQLKGVDIAKYLSDENAFRLYQIVGTVFDCVLEECKPKLTRYLLHCHDISPVPNYDPEKYYDDGGHVNPDDELPF